MIGTWKKWWAEETAPFVRIISGMIGLSLFVFGWDPLLNADQSAFDNPIFATAERLASLEAWGLGFWVASAFMLFAAFSGKFLIYTFALPQAVLVQLGWFMCILWAKVVDESGFTTTGIGLWFLALTATVCTTIVPTQLAGTKPVAVVLDSKTVPIEKVS